MFRLLPFYYSSYTYLRNSRSEDLVVAEADIVEGRGSTLWQGVVPGQLIKEATTAAARLGLSAWLVLLNWCRAELYRTGFEIVGRRGVLVQLLLLNQLGLESGWLLSWREDRLGRQSGLLLSRRAVDRLGVLLRRVLGLVLRLVCWLARCCRCRSVNQNLQSLSTPSFSSFASKDRCSLFARGGKERGRDWMWTALI